jgi:flagellar hook-associated protein 1 FlgK
VSGVNIDEEAVDLMRFQQAYQASTRVIQIARETLQSILDIR